MTGKINSFKDLEVWKKAHTFVLDIYKAVNKFPALEKYNISSQLLRASVSIPLNITEGFGRYSKKEFINFLIIARASSCEVEYLIILSRDLQYIDKDDSENFLKKIIEIRKMLNGLINSIRTK